MFNKTTIYTLVVAFLSVTVHAQSILISEVMPANDSVVTDVDGDYSDWIEVYNNSGSPIDLGGWFLTDDPAQLTKWMFPAVTLNAGQYMLVFASDKDRRVVGQELHTNFKLSASGEYLALVNPDGVTVEHHFSPTLPDLSADVSYGVNVNDPTNRGVFDTPTPGAANATLTLAAPSFNLEPQFFTSGPLTLEMSSPAGTEIYYITNSTSNWHKTIPDKFSTQYTGPISVNSTTIFKTITYDPATSSYSQLSYVGFGKLNSAMQSFSSDMPFYVMDTFGVDFLDVQQIALLAVYDVDATTGRASVNNIPAYVGFAGIRSRGSSTSNMNKRQWGIETWGNTMDDQPTSMLGFSKESDWVLEAPYEIDRSMIRVPFVFELGRQMGEVEVSDDRFVELFLNVEGGDVDATITAWDGSNADGVDYRGVHIMKHNIRESWLNLEDPLPLSERPAVTASSPIDDFDSFIFKYDRDDAGEVVLSTTYTKVGASQFVQHWPNGDELPLDANNYVQTFITALEDSFQAADFADENTGWRKYLDEDSVIDYHIIHYLAKEVDAFRFSFFAHKDRGEKMEFGPLWDYDRSLDSSVTNDNDYNRSDYLFDPYKNKEIIWLYPFFADAEFTKNWVDRFAELRKTVLSDANIDAIIDAHAAELQEAHERNYIRWPEDEGASVGQVLVPGEISIAPTWEGQVEHLKNWVKARLQFMEDALIPTASFNVADQIVLPGYNGLTMQYTSTPGNTGNEKLYFTTDGSDPRPEGNRRFYDYNMSLSSPAPIYNDGTADGSPLANAIEYTGQTITINKSTVVKARVYDMNYEYWDGAWRFPNQSGTRRISAWSGLQEVRLGVVESIPDLLITEIMYNAPDELTGDMTPGKRFEFIEIKNVGSTTVDISAFEIKGDINYTFPTTTTIAPNAHIVVANDLTEFANKYPTFSGTLHGPYRENLSNSGGTVRLVDPGYLEVTAVEFNDKAPWPIGADGLGFSLVPVNPNSNPNPSDAGNWRSSTNNGGSPGEDDPDAGSVPKILINEVLTHTDLPQKDSIELYNPTSSAVNIGGWFLTDDNITPKKYKIPSNTIPAGGYLILDEDDFGGSFLLSELGEEIYLYSADPSEELTGYVHGFDIEPLANGVSAGAYETSSLNNNDVHYVTMETLTLGSNNSAPLVGPIVISEFNYHPGLTGKEFVEITNISSSTVALYDTDNPANTWKLSGYDFDFPQGVTMAPGEIIVITGTDPASFRSAYSVPASVDIYQTIGSLSNDGEKLRIRRPGKPEIIWPFSVPYYTVDVVDYNDASPWPIEADGLGKTLERINTSSYGSDPINWNISSADNGTPGVAGTAPTGYMAWAGTAITNGGATGFSDDADNDSVLNGVEYALGLDPVDGTSASDQVLPICLLDSGKLQLQFTLPASIPGDVSYEIEAASTPNFASSTTLATLTAGSSIWTGSNVSPASVSGGEVITVTDTVSITGGTKRFLRLKIIIP